MRLGIEQHFFFVFIMPFLLTPDCTGLWKVARAQKSLLFLRIYFRVSGLDIFHGNFEGKPGFWSVRNFSLIFCIIYTRHVFFFFSYECFARYVDSSTLVESSMRNGSMRGREGKKKKENPTQMIICKLRNIDRFFIIMFTLIRS